MISARNERTQSINETILKGGLDDGTVSMSWSVAKIPIRYEEQSPETLPIESPIQTRLSPKKLHL